MKEIWYRADADYTTTSDGTDEYFCIKVEDPTNEEQMQAADEQAISLAKEWAAAGKEFSDVGHVGMVLVQVMEVDGNEECFPEIRSVWR